MTSKEQFLNFPVEEYATSIISIGDPGSGKSYVMIACIKEWIKMNVFTEIHLILPSFLNEKNDSYKGLDTYENVFVYENYRSVIAENLIKKSDKNNELCKKGKEERHRYLFCVDDATGEGIQLMKCPHLIKIATQGRHLNIQSWYCLHSNSAIIPPKIRNNIQYVFIYNLHNVLLKKIWESYINFGEFRKYNDFLEFWDNYVINQEHGCLLIKKNKWYSPKVSTWFSK